MNSKFGDSYIERPLRTINKIKITKRQKGLICHDVGEGSSFFDRLDKFIIPLGIIGIIVLIIHILWKSGVMGR